MNRFLDKIYDVGDPDEMTRLYDEWATGYDAELIEAGYATPQRCAEALRGFVIDPRTPVLDVGCGTGLSGAALRRAGFDTVDGVDASQGMVRQARAKGVYRNLDVVEPEAPLPQGYAAISAMGVIGAGAAPLTLLERIIDALSDGGFAVFSFNDHTLADPAFRSAPDDMEKTGRARIPFREHGPHLPAQDLEATVYVLQKS